MNLRMNALIEELNDQKVALFKLAEVGYIGAPAAAHFMRTLNDIEEALTVIADKNGKEIQTNNQPEALTSKEALGLIELLHTSKKEVSE